ncbi:MAG: DUF721 domain-containing protein [Spirochaetes bacterium]|jgi:hypothetical protein|nr:DUF721 domain-containing protein [Spirochaetota bacterium]
MERAGDLLEAFLRLHNITGGEEYVAFFKSWHRIVGTDIAAHTRVTDIRNGALKVEVDHPGWMQMLQMRKDEIVRKVAGKYPQLEVRNIHMRLVGSFSGPGPGTGAASERAARKEGAAEEAGSDVDGVPGSGGAESRAEGEAPVSREDSKNAREALERIEDEGFRETLSRLYRDLQNKNAD